MSMKDELTKFIESSSFPCIMAKSVLNTGIIEFQEINDLYDSNETRKVLEKMYSFIRKFKNNEGKLASFILFVKNPVYKNFTHFEKAFWSFLVKLNSLDKKKFEHDSRVASDPHNANFGFSIMEEAFFLLALHPESERRARRFKTPAIVFNPHEQFENLRRRGVFHKIKNLIRRKDQILQGFSNPMLTDFGEKTEVFQYLGKKYSPRAAVPLHL